MAHVVVLDAREKTDDTWPLPLGGPLGPGAAIEAARDAAGDAWVLVASPRRRTLLNGRVTHTGLHVLHAGDEIRTHDGLTFVFAVEQHAACEPFPGADRPVRCGRCTTEIEAGTAAVRCPGCSSWFHEHGEFTCWSLAPFCQVCGYRAPGQESDTSAAGASSQQES